MGVIYAGRRGMCLRRHGCGLGTVIGWIFEFVFGLKFLAFLVWSWVWPWVMIWANLGRLNRGWFVALTFCLYRWEGGVEMKPKSNGSFVLKLLGVVLVVADVGVDYGSVVWLRKRHCGVSLIHVKLILFYPKPSMNSKHGA